MHYKELEQMFTDDFSSPIFPILAEHYLNDNQLQRASKVCMIGLKNNPENLYGKFILSKIFIIEESFLKAEKNLKIVVKNSINIEALFLLIDISIKLNRSKLTIQKLIILINQWVPNHTKVKRYKKKYLKNNKNNTSKTEKPIFKNNALKVKIDNKLATKTMYNLLLKQKKYYHALEVLNLMKLNKKNSQFIKNNKPDLLKKIKKKDL